MKATGIIRRIDDLGRVVIPKEIRRNCNIREGEPQRFSLRTAGQYSKSIFPTVETIWLRRFGTPQIIMMTMKMIEPSLGS